MFDRHGNIPKRSGKSGKINVFEAGWRLLHHGYTIF